MSTAIKPDGLVSAVEEIEWDPITQDVDGNDITVVSYEVWVRAADQDELVLVTTTDTTEATLPDLVAGQTYYVQIRGISADGEPGVFDEDNAEFELIADSIPTEEAPDAGDPTSSDPTLPPIPVPPLTPATAPILTSELGTVSARWDGLLTAPADTLVADPGGATGDPAVGVPTTQFPPQQFVYVYASTSLVSGGPYTAAGQHLGHAGATILPNFNVGDIVKVVFTAVDNQGIETAVSAESSVTVVGVDAPDIMANAITANKIAVGAVDARSLSLGARLGTGETTQRVPSLLTDSAYWALLIAGTVVFDIGTATPATRNVAASSAGIVMTPTSTLTAVLWVMQKRAVPLSGQVYTKWTSTGANALLRIVWYDSAGTPTYVTVPNGQNYSFPSTAVTYSARLELAAAAAAETVSVGSVFEVLGTNVTGQQNAFLSPSGLQLTNDDGSAGVDLTTSGSNFLSINQRQLDGTLQPVATIDENGDGSFQDISISNSLDFSGADLMGTFPDFDRNGIDTDASFFDQIPWGQIAAFTWTPDLPTNVTTQRRGIASGSFLATPGRTLQFLIDVGNIYVTNNGSGNIQAILKLSDSPIAVTDTGRNVSAGVQFAGGDVYQPKLNPVTIDVAPAGTTQDGNTVPVDATGLIYWFLLYNTSVTTPSYAVANGVAATGQQIRMTVQDIGPSVPLIDATNNVSSGSSSGSSGVGKSITKTATAAWSRSWNQSGTNIVSGSGTYTDADMMYQGFGASPMASKFGFNSLAISGSTITSMKLYLKNRSFYNSAGGLARLGTHGSGSAQPTFGSRANAFDVHWGRGEGKWINVPSSLWAGFASGTYRGFSLGVSSSATDFAYFDGAPKGSPPKLKYTYHA